MEKILLDSGWDFELPIKVLFSDNGHGLGIKALLNRIEQEWISGTFLFVPFDQEKQINTLSIQASLNEVFSSA